MRILLVAAIALAACGGGAEEEGAAANDTPASAEESSGGGGETITLEAVRSCAGFSAEDAARVLGVAATEIEDVSQDLYEGARQCGYRSSSDPAVGVAFSLVLYETVQEAADQMTYTRQNAGLAQGTIEGVTGQASGEPALEEAEGIGDDAFWMVMNKTLDVRVENVLVQVQLPEDRDRQKAVADAVVEGLRGG